jgi:hypothetical protein
MGTMFGRHLQTPADLRDWVYLAVVLMAIAVCYARVGGAPTALLALAAGVSMYAFDGRLFVSTAVACAGGLALLMGKRTHAGDRRIRALREGALIGTGLLLYESGRAALVGNQATALKNADDVITVERRWDLAFEPAVQRAVVGHERLMVLFNSFYSWGFFSIVMGVLFWLYVSDDAAFRAMRTGLGISALLALATIAVFPVAPPRLTPASGLRDMHALMGHGHGFVNPYAAIPSLHVGWTLLAGYALGRSLGTPVGRVLAMVPAVLMMTTVIVTGNHFWMDGVIGGVYAVIPVVVLGWMAASHVRPRQIFALRRSVRRVFASGWAIFSMVGLGVLLVYLVVRQAVDPGFTHYWGYQVVQIAVTIALLFALEVAFAAQGGLAWYAHLLVTADTWADTLGTAGHLYDRYAVYDKVTHFCGGVALTAVAASILSALSKRGVIHWSLATRLAMAVAATIVLNIGWEAYEYLGDVVLGTGRHQGELDTTYDFVSDITGALVVVVSLWRLEATSPVARPTERPEAARG